ncbi:MAG TPA: hypothetical protein VGG94_04860 [Chthoniobacterales bacterium]
MSSPFFILGAFLVGFATGLRAFTPIALLSWVAVWGWMPLGGSRVAFLGTTLGGIIITALAVGELISDKLPITPSRLAPGPLGGRVIMSSLAGAALAIGTGQWWILGVIGWVAGSLAGAFGGFHVRRALVMGLGVVDWLVAVLEDLITFCLVLLVLGLFF